MQQYDTSQPSFPSQGLPSYYDFNPQYSQQAMGMGGYNTWTPGQHAYSPVAGNNGYGNSMGWFGSHGYGW